MSTARPDKAHRPYELVVFGATGFTGQLVAEYLAAHYGDTVRWAMAGRSLAKLEQVRRRLVETYPAAAQVPLLVADSNDRSALDEVARSTRAVITTAGPFLKLGLTLAAACAENGTDYCDLTGETPFVRELIDRHHETARQTGARLVPCSGFDSIPSDLGVLMLHEEAKKRGLELGATRTVVGSLHGGFSGGTIASMMMLMELAASDRNLRRLMGNPYALNPKGGPRGPDGSDQMGPRYDKDLGRWTGPFVMAAINTRVVRRSNALLGQAYGRDFRYAESMATGRGPMGALTSTGLSGFLGGLVATMSTAPGRAVLKRVLPAPGEGPSREAQARGSFRMHVLSHTLKEGVPGPVLKGLVAGNRDPGYSGTALMIAETGLCLARDEAAAHEGGVLTPASGPGAPLIERLRRAGMTFEVQS
jgi:short subunit dehydrogenase-like uncharacterized protein